MPVVSSFKKRDMWSVSWCFQLISLFAISQLFVCVVGKPVNSPSLRNLKKFRIPTIYSGPLPVCAPMQWPQVDPCHKHKCKKSIHGVIANCKTLGVTCGEGKYLKISDTAKSSSECCKCKKFER